MYAKSEAIEYFKIYKAMIELETGKKIKVLRSDGGGEYCSDEFERFLAEHGIKHQTTTSYTPEQNGISERRNRTIFEKGRTLLKHARLPQCFLG